MIGVWESFILGVVEGITEFLPISSTGHLMVTSSLLGIEEDQFLKAFTVAIQLGAIMAVVVLYWKRFFKSLNFYYKLFVAFLPAGIIGFLCNKLIDRMLGDVMVVAWSFFIGGVILLFIDRWFKNAEKEPDKEILYKNALVIGFFQAISMIPGVSRSAATIVGGLSQKLNRKSAVEFSFFLAVPTMFVATAYKLFEYYKGGGGFHGQEIQLLLIGNIVAFVVAIIAIKFFITYLQKHGFRIFGIYRILAAIAIYWLHRSGVQFVL
ncbi:MAG TPA: undecaprenyl-diphosphate phosphatase [Bacteroidia bacterium]|nr:undecaprenyl-diphosphate phosphatase [Bacteroidia bacterium]